MQLGNTAQAKSYFRKYLDKAPEAADRKDIEDMIKSL
jgi:hypothetical protein